jgi:hypothetical protein
MQSKKRVEPLDTFETDVPITEADHAALWRLRELNTMNSQEYLEFLRRFEKSEDGSEDRNDHWPEPFEL